MVSFKLILGAIALAILSAAHGALQQKTDAQLEKDLLKKIPNNSFLSGPKGTTYRRTAVKLMRDIIAKGHCNPNICFALDGSGSITKTQYRLQKEFVELVAALISIDDTAHFAAVQYGLRLRRISSLTHKANTFLLRVEKSVLASDPRTFISPGIGFCVRQMRDRLEDANKIVLLGDGRNNFGIDNPRRVLKEFVHPHGNGEICAVGIGNINYDKLRKITGSYNLIFGVQDYFDLADLIDEIVGGICELNV